MNSNYRELEQKAKKMVRAKYDENIELLKKTNANPKIRITTNEIKEEVKAFVSVFGIVGLTFLLVMYVIFYGYPF